MTSGGAETERRPEKSSFSVTCSLLGKYMKEKCSIADLGLGVLDSAPMEIAAGASKKLDFDLFDNFPAEKAKDLMQLASKGRTFTSATLTSVVAAASVPPMADVQRSPTQTKPPASFRAGAQHKFSDLPIARKASIRCFLKKRRDRISAKAAPYPLSSSSGLNDYVALKKEEISQPWLGLV